MINNDSYYTSWYSSANDWPFYTGVCKECGYRLKSFDSNGFSVDHDKKCSKIISVFKWCLICENKWLTKHTCLSHVRSKDWLDVISGLK